MKRRGGAALAAACLAILLGAPADAGRSRIGTTGAPFLKIGFTPRLSGMGEAYGAVGDDVGAIFSNPAGLDFIRRKEAMFVHANLIADLNLDSLSYAHPLPEPFGVISANYLNLSYGDIDRTILLSPGSASPFARAGTFTARDQAFSLAYADDLYLGHRRLHWGVTGKIINQKIAEDQATGFALDLGLRYHPPQRPYRFGATLQNLGFLSKFRDVADPLPLTLKLSGATDLWRDRVTLSSDLNFPIDNNPILTMGVEVRPISFLALRGGYRYDNNTTDFKGPSAGVGINWAGIYLDYSYVPFEVLGENHRFSLKVAFGGEKTEPEGPPTVEETVGFAPARGPGAAAPASADAAPKPPTRPRVRKERPGAPASITPKDEDAAPVPPPAAAPAAAPVLAGPVPVSGGILFRFQAPSAERVALTGSFNDWIPARTPMARGDDGIWWVRLPLPPGRHLYKFFVDGNVVMDPANPLREPDGFGGSNSVVVVQ